MRKREYFKPNHNRLKKDNEYFEDGKTLLNTITEFAKTYGMTKEQFKKDICDSVMRYEDFGAFKRKLKSALVKYFK